MKMDETNRTFADDEGDKTMVTPRFDDEETVLARPVVPFEEVGAAPAASATAAPPQPLYTRLRAAPRRSLVAALVLASALGGSVLGVGGLYFYQKHRNADATPAAEQQQADAPAAAQPTAEAASQSRETSAPAAAPSSPAPTTSEPEVQTDDDDADSAKDKGSEKADDSPVVTRRNASEDREDSTVAPKRGKKGERDEEIRRESRRSNRDDDEDRPVRADDSSDDDRREARRVGVITYRPRRARQRRDNYDTPDRLRRIFEGQP
jgi:hypothetical protein